MTPVFPNDFTYKVLNVMDTPSEDLGRYFKECNTWIANAIGQGGVVFVHW